MDNWDLDALLSQRLISEATTLIRDLSNLVIEYLAPIAMPCESIFDAMSNTTDSYENWSVIIHNKYELLSTIRKPVVYSSVKTSIERLDDGGYSMFWESWTIVGCVNHPLPSTPAYFVLSISIERTMFGRNVRTEARYFETLKQAVDTLDYEKARLFHTFQHEYCNSVERKLRKICYLCVKTEYDFWGKCTLDYRTLRNRLDSLIYDHH